MSPDITKYLLWGNFSPPTATRLRTAGQGTQSLSYGGHGTLRGSGVAAFLPLLYRPPPVLTVTPACPVLTLTLISPKHRSSSYFPSLRKFPPNFPQYKNLLILLLHGDSLVPLRGF